MEFGWDVSLRAAPRKGGQAVSKWLREENETDMWARMDVDGESMERVFGADVTNRGDHREGGGPVGWFSRQVRLVTKRSILDIPKNAIREGEGVGMKDFPAEFIDGKKRQRFHSEVGNGEREMDSKNAISAAIDKLADRAQ